MSTAETATQIAGTGFVLAVMAWVVYRMTGVVVDLATRRRAPRDQEPEEEEP